MKSTLIIKLSGKACQVFRLFDLFCQKNGNKKMVELQATLSQVVEEDKNVVPNENV